MKIGDYVRVLPSMAQIRQSDERFVGKKGIILDMLVLDDGFPSFEVMFEDEIGWFEDLELEVLSEE